MILGIGCDLLEIGRMERLLRRRTGLDRIFTERELSHAAGRSAVLAGDFCVKEALSKAFGTGLSAFSLPEVEVLRDPAGKPYVVLYGRARALYERLGGRRILVSISDTRELVMAQALLEG
ncbi:MAG: holo-ACP synthase [Oribacterium sp.]